MSLLSLVRKEVAQQLISAKFAVMTLLVVLLALVSVVVMHRDYQLRLENYELLRPTENDTVAIKPPAPMSVLVRGLDERMGRSMTVETVGSIDVGSSQSAANRLFALFRELDMQYVALVILSLAAVLFSFDMVSGEKQRGTLKLVLANGVSRARVLLAKWLGALIAVAIPSAVAVLVSLLYLRFGTGMAMDGDFFLRTTVFFVLLLLFLAAFVGVGLLISCLTHRPALSLVFAMLAWGLLVFVVPNAAAMAGGIIVGGESLAQKEVKVRQIWTSEVFKAINDPRSGTEGFNPWDETYRRTAQRLAGEYRDYINLAAARVGWAKALSRLSPAGPFSFASWSAAGTSPEDALRFKRDVVRYQAYAIEDARILRSIARGFRGAPEEFEARAFEDHPRSLADAISEEIIPEAGVLAGMAMLLFAAGFFAFARYDVR